MILYLPFNNMTQYEKDQLLANFIHHVQTFDHDMVVTSAMQVLESMGKEGIHALKVGSICQGLGFNLSSQLREKMADVADDIRYVIFSLPVNKELHSVAVVIDRSSRRCFYIDSLARYSSEAHFKLLNTTGSGEVLEGYEVVGPRTRIVQQNDGPSESEWSCGIHSAANIVGIITGDIVPETGVGIHPRTLDEVNYLTAMLYKAYQDGCAKREEALKSSHLVLMEIKTLRFALTALKTTSGGQIGTDIDILLSKLTTTYPPVLSVEDFQHKQSFQAFLLEFKNQYPDNSLIPLLYTENYKHHLPLTLQDDLGNKSEELCNYLQIQLLQPAMLREQEDKGSSAASSSSPVSATSGSQAASSRPVDSVAATSGSSQDDTVTEWQNKTMEQMHFLLTQGKNFISQGKVGDRSATGSIRISNEENVFRYWRILASIPADQYLLKSAVIIKVALDNLAPNDIANYFNELTICFNKLPFGCKEEQKEVIMAESEGLIRYDFPLRILALYITANQSLFDQKTAHLANFRSQENGLEQLFGQRHARIGEKVYSEYIYLTLFVRLFDKNKPALEIIGESSLPCASNGSSHFFAPASSSHPNLDRLADASYEDLPPALQAYIADRNKGSGGDFSAAEFWFVLPDRRDFLEGYFNKQQELYPSL